VNVAKQIRTTKKAYSAHPSIIIALLDMPFSALTEGQIAGQLVDTAAANNMDDMYFWRTPQKDEIDFIQGKNRSFQ
jgi:predicted AAA+ superfamily ATPase